MVEEVVLIAYSEIGIKSPPVRRFLEHQLSRNIINSLKLAGIQNAKIRKIQGRLIVEGEKQEEIVKTSVNVFGVTSATHVKKLSSDMDEIIKEAIDSAFYRIKNNQTFAVKARRVGKHTYTSLDIVKKVGEEILKHLKSRKIKVNLNNPDVVIQIEVRDNETYIHLKTARGPSGLPFGSQGRLVGLFSGGIDSPVAAWFMMKRGADVKLLFLDQRPFIGEDYYKRAISVAKKLRKYVPLKRFLLYIAPMGKIMEEIRKNAAAKLTCLICKRMMYRIACGLAEKIGADGIVTGENLGQVASQTLVNLKVLDEASKLPVYRPLIGFEKMEIVDWAKKIGTYNSSITPIHGCSSVPAKPATKADIEEVLAVERKIACDELVSNALENIVHCDLNQKI